MEEMKWKQLDAASGTLNYVDEEKHYLIQQHEPDKFGVVWLRYPDAFMNFCETPDKAKEFCESHKKYFAGLSAFVSGESAVDKTVQ